MYTDLKADGSTSSGCWIYSGVYAKGVEPRGQPQARSRAEPGRAGVGLGLARQPPDPLQPASADPEGKPWSERKKYVWWDEENQTWTGLDTPDFVKTKAPSYRPEPGTGGPDGLAGDDPFVMMADGKGWLFAPKGMLDGPLPTHYEPQESPVQNPLYGQQSNPARRVFPRKDNLWSPSGTAPGSEVYPFVFTPTGSPSTTRPVA